MSFGIRAPLMQDEQALVGLFSQPGVIHGLGNMPFTSTKWVRRRLETKNPNYYPLVATVNSDAIGWARLTRYEDRFSHSGSFEICIHDAYAGKGVGRALLNELIEIADKWLGLTRIEADVFANNPAALALYESVGFEREGLKRGAVLTNGELVDTHVLGRLRPAA